MLFLSIFACFYVLHKYSPSPGFNLLIFMECRLHLDYGVEMHAMQITKPLEKNCQACCQLLYASLCCLFDMLGISFTYSSVCVNVMSSDCLHGMLHAQGIVWFSFQ